MTTSSKYCQCSRCSVIRQNKLQYLSIPLFIFVSYHIIISIIPVGTSQKATLGQKWLLTTWKNNILFTDSTLRVQDVLKEFHSGDRQGQPKFGEVCCGKMFSERKHMAFVGLWCGTMYFIYHFGISQPKCSDSFHILRPVCVSCASPSVHRRSWLLTVPQDLPGGRWLPPRSLRPSV